MGAKNFDAWTRRRFGLATGGALAALLVWRDGDEAIAKKRKRRCLKQGRACVGGGKRPCCGKLACQDTIINGIDDTFCCTPDGASCASDATVCCSTFCHPGSGTCTTCAGRECAGDQDCCPRHACENSFCGGCANFGEQCSDAHPCCDKNDTCESNGWCGGCRRSPDVGIITCEKGGVPCCDTDCDGSQCLSAQGGPCRLDKDCIACGDPNQPDHCDGYCVGGHCTV